MLKKISLLLLVSMLGTASALAACSDEELEAKADTFAQAVAKAAEKDAKKVNQLMVDLEPALEKAQSGENDDMCKFYDDVTQKLQAF